jgi:hypothetical protein
MLFYISVKLSEMVPENELYDVKRALKSCFGVPDNEYARF